MSKGDNVYSAQVSFGLKLRAYNAFRWLKSGTLLKCTSPPYNYTIAYNAVKPEVYGVSTHDNDYLPISLSLTNIWTTLEIELISSMRGSVERGSTCPSMKGDHTIVWLYLNNKSVRG
ncbi:hypothetical protein Plhal304r1_c049g0131671 [Plasmopara halstedii]